VLSIRPVLALTLAGALALSACGSDDDGGDDAVVISAEINVGRTSDPLSQLMAEIYGQGLENAGYRVGRKDPVADDAALVAGLEADSVQFMPASTKGLLEYFAGNGGTASDAPLVADQLVALRDELPDTLTLFEPANVSNGIVIACSAAAIDEFTLATVSDLVAATGVTLGGSDDFAAGTPGGIDALNTAYTSELTVTSVDDVGAAITDGTVDCGALTELSTAIVTEGLIVLDDDLGFASDDSLVPLMTLAAGQADVQSVVDAINATLTTDIVRSLLVKVELNADSYDVIAKQFLATQASDS
jgi:osmoprotectant transport system substrate-binding protein